MNINFKVAGEIQAFILYLVLLLIFNQVFML